MDCPACSGPMDASRLWIGRVPCIRWDCRNPECEFFNPDESKMNTHAFDMLTGDHRRSRNKACPRCGRTMSERILTDKDGKIVGTQYRCVNPNCGKKK